MTGQPPPGPVAALIANASPMLEAVPMGALGGGPQLAAAVHKRAGGSHLCLVCGGPAVTAVIAWPRDSGHSVPVWCDLCVAHAVALHEEQTRASS